MALKVALTGAAGQISYSLAAMVARGDMFGPDQGVVATDKPEVAFNDVDAVLLVGAMPRREGMERKDLLKANVKIFEQQGKALNEYAKKTVKVVVVGNPANTNCLIASMNAPTIPKENFSALTRLDHNRALAQLSLKSGEPVNSLRNVTIWGNHSVTQFADASNVQVVPAGGGAAHKLNLNDDDWLKHAFLTTVQKRGGTVLAARKASSAMSAAKAITDHMRDWWCGTSPDTWVSMGVVSDGSYGIPKDIVFSFPVTIKNKTWTVVPNLKIDDWAQDQITLNVKELDTEKTMALAVCQ